MGGVYGEGGLAQAGLSADHRDGWVGGVEVFGQSAEPVQGGAACGEVGEIAWQSQRVVRGGLCRCSACRRAGGPGCAAGAGAAQGGGTFQIAGAGGVQSQGGGQGLDRAALWPPGATAFHVRHGPHADPRGLRQFLLAELRTRPQGVQARGEPPTTHG